MRRKGRRRGLSGGTYPKYIPTLSQFGITETDEAKKTAGRWCNPLSRQPLQPFPRLTPRSAALKIIPDASRARKEKDPPRFVVAV
jgi:hypothetical protein